MIHRPVPQSEIAPSYFEGFWHHSDEEYPVRFMWEVELDGSVIRQIEYFADGSAKADAVSNYPDGATDFGFGTLHGASFWESEWDDEKQEVGITNSNQETFERAWTQLQ